MDELAGDMPLWVERLVLAAHHRVHDNRRAVVESAGRVVAQDDGEGDALGMAAYPAQREQVVAVQAGVADLHAHPPLRHVRLGPLATSWVTLPRAVNCFRVDSPGGFFLPSPYR